METVIDLTSSEMDALRESRKYLINSYHLASKEFIPILELLDKLFPILQRDETEIDTQNLTQVDMTIAWIREFWKRTFKHANPSVTEATLNKIQFTIDDGGYISENYEGIVIEDINSLMNFVIKHKAKDVYDIVREMCSSDNNNVYYFEFNSSRIYLMKVQELRSKELMK